MNKIKNAFNKAQNKVNELAIRAKTAIQNKSLIWDTGMFHP